MNKVKDEKVFIPRLLRKQPVFEIVFCSLLLMAAFSSLYILIASNTELQNTYFFDGAKSGDMFMDFYNVLRYVSKGDPYRFEFPVYQPETAYPPFAYMLLYPFSRIVSAEFFHQSVYRTTQFGLMALMGFLIISIVPMALLIYMKKNGTAFVKSVTLLTFFTSGVFIFAVERANTILLAAFFLGAFLLGYQSEDKRVRELSYLCLAIAASLKVYPVIFGILILKDKRFFAAGRTVLYGAVCFFMPFLLYPGPGECIRLMIENVGKNTERYLMQNPTFRFGFVPFHMVTDTTYSQVQLFVILSYIFLALALLSSLFAKKNWKAAMVLSVALIATPTNSAYYCGVYLFAAILLFLNEKEHSLTDWIYLPLMVLILNPLQFVDSNMVLHTGRIANAALLAMYVLLIVDGLICGGRRIYDSSRRQVKHTQVASEATFVKEAS